MRSGAESSSSESLAFAFVRPRGQSRSTSMRVPSCASGCSYTRLIFSRIDLLPVRVHAGKVLGCAARAYGAFVPSM